MIARNFKEDVVVIFPISYSINRLLNAVGDKYIIPKQDPDLSVYRKTVEPKFSVNKNGDFRLFSNVMRGHSFKQPNGRTEIIENGAAGSLKGCFADRVYSSDAELEEYSEYFQGINDKYRRLSYEIEIKI